MSYGPKMRRLIFSAEVDLDNLIRDGDDRDISDIIFEIADGTTPIYNSDILETVSETPSLWSREPELGPAFDGTPTPVNIGASVIFEVLQEELWEHARDKGLV